MWHRQAFAPFNSASRPCLARDVWFLSMKSRSWPLLALLCIMEMADIGACVLKVATYHVRITTPSQSLPSLHIQHSCQESVDIWPTFPIIIGYYAYWRPSSLAPIDEDNVIAALKHTSRVCEIWFRSVTGTELSRITTVMQEPFPALTHFILQSKDRNVLVIPSQFLGQSVPCLQELSLDGIPFPALLIFLLSASNLIALKLYNIPQTGYILPKAMVAGPAMLTRLRHLHIGFQLPNSCPDQIYLPPTTRWWTACTHIRGGHRVELTGWVKSTVDWCHDSTILFSLFMPTFFFLVYFTLSHVTLLSHGSHVQSHDRSPDLSHDEGT